MRALAGQVGAAAYLDGPVAPQPESTFQIVERPSGPALKFIGTELGHIVVPLDDGVCACATQPGRRAVMAERHGQVQ